MNWKRNPASNWRLYCIIDRGVLRGKDPVRAAKELYKRGADVVQLRYKNRPSHELVRIARRIQRLADRYGKAFLVDDRVDVATASGSSGVHIGKSDLSLSKARLLLNPRSIVGRTVHSTGEAKHAAGERINYMSAGPVFATPLKKSLRGRGTGFVKKIKGVSSVPVFAIGGINKGNMRTVLESGVDGICVTRAASQAKALRRELDRRR